MGWIEDTVEEFKKLPPAGKIAVGGAAVGVAILAYARYRSNPSGVGSGSAGSVTGAFPGAVGIPTSTDGAGGIWTFPPTVQSATGVSGTFLGSLGLAPGPSGGVRTPPPGFGAGQPTIQPVTSAPPAAPSFVQRAAAHVASSATAHAPQSAPTNPMFIPTTIRPLPTPGRGRVA